ncbi:hypothetical protein LptCag_1296 [Leptospirillum ferriphilum]|uniref:Uncharacterized protein n=1 Tax=Leptospirillum ferriphilum TaxID=178606 RepID=A0A094X2X6_9BACT|nr:hypothetical protein LptCag_1296 [Leptospirillum ferriphilum]
MNDFLRVSFMRRILGGRSQGVKSLFCLPVFSAWVFALFVILASGCQSAETAHTADLSDETPTPIRFDARPVPTLLPRTNLYLFFSSDRPLYYREGEYFQYWHKHWFAADDLRGPWNPITPYQLPDLLQSVPPDYYYDNFPYKLRKEN